MPLLPAYITVREDVQLERAIAAMGLANDDEISESFIDEVSTRYPHCKAKETVAAEGPEETD